MTNRSKILIVDDRSENLFALENLLKPLEVDIVKAASGDEALKATLKNEFSLAILDVQMPGMDGFELAKLLRGPRATRTIPIIFLTAHNPDEARVFLGYESGAVDFITKPVKPEILLPKVGVFLELDRSRRELLRQKTILESMVEQSERANEQLQKEIKARQQVEAELRLAKEGAEAASRAKSEFLANMSHEIRTPMNGVLGMTDLALMEDISQDAREYLQIVKQSGRALLEIINDILDLSKIESGKVVLVNKPFGLREGLESMFKAFAVIAQGKEITFHKAIDLEVPGCLVGDLGRIRQVLTNLIGNAVKFSGKGTVRVSVALDRQPTAPGTVGLIFTVKDEGIGIAEDRLEDVFEAFSQAGLSSHAKYGGTGLGLSISKNLVEMMGGEIRAESILGQGSTFSFTVPFGLAEEQGQSEPRTARAAVPASGQLRILLAEDDLVNRIYAVRLLEQLGHQVGTAQNGREAIEKLKATDFDLVLMDMRMPDMNGQEALQAIRQGQAGRDKATVMVVALTAYALKGDREKFLEEGMDDYLAKPIDTEELKRVLAEVRCRISSAKGTSRQ